MKGGERYISCLLHTRHRGSNLNPGMCPDRDLMHGVMPNRVTQARMKMLGFECG